MTKTKKSLFAVVMAVVMLFTGLASLGGADYKKASAAHPNYSGQDVYYFTDSYPILDEDEFCDYYGNNSICYDKMYFIGESTLEALWSSGYFYDIQNCTVIFQIRYTPMDPYVLRVWFEYLQNNGCTVIFLSGYNDYYYSNTEFMDFCTFIKCNKNLRKFYNYIANAVADMAFNRQLTEGNACILLDGRFFDFTVTGMGMDFNDVFQSSKFFRVLIEQLCDRLEITYDEEDAEGMRNQLIAQNVWLVVHIGENEYYNLLTHSIYSSVIDGLNSLTEVLIKGENEYQADKFFAMGISDLEVNYYDFLFFIEYSDGYDLPVYIWEEDPVVYGSGGLSVMTDSDLRDAYVEEYWLGRIEDEEEETENDGAALENLLNELSELL